MYNVNMWEQTLVQEMDAATYDKTVSDPWFGTHPFLTNHDQPLVLAFTRRLQANFPDVATAKDSFTIKTLYLLAQDFGHNFRFSFVDVHNDPDWIAVTYDMRSQYDKQ